MLLGLAFDGADSPQGGCTTHLVSLLFLKLCKEGIQPYDYPWLIRLNPAVPHKTRGNGALVLWLQVDTPIEAERLYREASKLTREYARATGSADKAALAALLMEEESLEERPWPLKSLYLLAVNRYVPRDTAIRYLKLAARSVRHPIMVEGRGVVGPLAALGADMSIDYTFELLFYMPPALWGNRPQIDSGIVKSISYMLGPFDIATYDYQNGKPLIQPHGPDPVLAGIRSDDDKLLLKAGRLIPEDIYTHAVLFRTNQHTDAHLEHCSVREAYPYTCCTIEGILTRLTKLPKGHLVGQVCDHTGCISVAFYRETGILRRSAERYEDRRVAVAGCIRPHRGTLTLNVEKIIDYEAAAVYEPPPSAWHHLYMPFSRYQRTTRPRGFRPNHRACDAVLQHSI